LDFQFAFPNLTFIKLKNITLKMIGIDDVQLLDSCNHKNDRFCDFEVDICNYTTYGVEFGWTRGSASELNSPGKSPQGPSVDQ
jgi:hypothetical protein